MKGIAKQLFADLIAWRWAPAAGLLAASTLYVIVVVGVVPSEIGVPVANAKFAPKTPSTGAGTAVADTTTASYANTQNETEQESAPASPPSRVTGSEFGRRGFSPRLDRPEPPPPAPAAPPPTPPVIYAPSTPIAANPAPPGPGMSGIFSRIQGALRPASQAANAAAAAQAARAAEAAASATAPAASGDAAQPGQPAQPTTPGTPSTPGQAGTPGQPGTPDPNAAAPPTQAPPTQ